MMPILDDNCCKRACNCLSVGWPDRALLSGAVHSGQWHTTSQGPARNAACCSTKFAATIGQGMFVFQHLFQLVIQDTCKGIHCSFITVSVTPLVECSHRHQTTCSTTWLVCGEQINGTPAAPLSCCFTQSLVCVGPAHHTRRVPTLPATPSKFAVELHLECLLGRPSVV